MILTVYHWIYGEVLDEPQKGMKFKHGEGAVADVHAETERYGVIKSKH